MNDVFADIFNVLVFGGKQVVTPDALENITGFIQYKADDTKMHEPERDMPFRGISCDGASCRSQVLKTKNITVNGRKKTVKVKERYPVVTIVLYFDEKPWR